MKTGRLFNQKQLIEVSGLSQGQIRQLQKYELSELPIATGSIFRVNFKCDRNCYLTF
ncbi:MAG: hypothetical protein QNJ72_37735 [Pleurocapsa sp. MO_226.B13]|nr:hypothetical protein [Pleurocapsa sp. MO_226.B13]